MVLITSLEDNGFQVRRLQLRGDAFVLAFLYGMQYFRYHIIVVTEGQLHVNSGTQGLTAVAMDVCIVPPDSYMKASGGKTVMVWLVRFTETYLTQTLYAARNTTITAFLEQEELYSLMADTFHFEIICQLLQLLGKHQQSGTPHHAETIVTLTFNLLLNCLLELRAHTESRFTNAVRRKEQLTIAFLRLVEQQAGMHHEVGYYADVMCMTRGNLTKTVRQLTGKSPKILISEALVRLAQELLDSSDAPVYGIAEALHFSSSSAFVNFFRHHSGLTPEAYRNRKNR
ncbi:AraC family transcriptional regulator [Flavobacterium sp. NRK1]|uniref:helix-turn-helix domain-containing protein n=1 Tax=Flavobacterium sp. NRK1 TaxID=2954929 RepID=UPI002093CD2B|nr:helix-turn-helix domain-containing protein [Flavobacterium sp. NRK1]MCO6148973.1 helix-turn-helix domain-containing protein [Flavobacterium sp. NRK1]